MKRTLRTTHAIARSPECDALNRCFPPAHGRIFVPPKRETGRPAPWSRETKQNERPGLRGVRDDISDAIPGWKAHGMSNEITQ
jgi:hypothetical protein